MSRFASSYSRGVRMVLEHGAAVLRLPRPVEQAARKARLKRGVDVDVDQVGEKEGLEKGHESLSEVSIKPRRLSALAEARARKVFREQGWTWPTQPPPPPSSSRPSGNKNQIQFANSVVRMKGHKYELEKKRRQHTIEQKMAAMEEMVKEYRMSRKGLSNDNNKNRSAEDLYDELYLTQKERKTKLRRKMQNKAQASGK